MKLPTKSTINDCYISLALEVAVLFSEQLESCLQIINERSLRPREMLLFSISRRGCIRMMQPFCPAHGRAVQKANEHIDNLQISNFPRNQTKLLLPARAIAS